MIQNEFIEIGHKIEDIHNKIDLAKSLSLIIYIASDSDALSIEEYSGALFILNHLINDLYQETTCLKEEMFTIIQTEE